METEQKSEKVTAQDVEQAFDDILRRGKLKPSQKDVLAELKRGSETTIRQHLNQLYQARLNPDREDPLSIPAEIQTDFLQLWRKAGELASMQWREARETLNAEVVAIRQEMATQQADHEQAQQTQQQTIEQLEQALAQQAKIEQSQHTQIEQFQQDLARERQALADSETARQAERAQVTALNVAADAQKAAHQQQLSDEQLRSQQIEDRLHGKIDTLRQDKKNVEQEAKRSALDYQTHQKTWLTAKDQWRDDAQALNNQLLEKEQHLSIAQTQLTHLTQQQQDMRQHAQGLTQQLADAHSAREQAHDQLIREQALHGVAQTQVERLTAELEATKAALIQEQIINRQLSASLEEEV